MKHIDNYIFLTAHEQAELFLANFPNVIPDDFKFFFNPGSLQFGRAEQFDREKAANIFFDKVLQGFKTKHNLEFRDYEMLALLFGPELRLFSTFNNERLSYIERLIDVDKFVELLAVRQETYGLMGNGARPSAQQFIIAANDLFSQPVRGLAGL